MYDLTIKPNVPVVATFHKVSYEEFKKNFDMPESELKDLYENILTLPVHGSDEAMGHDFVSTVDFELKPGESIKIPLGIRAEIQVGWGLLMFPRSGLGSKYRLQIDNTVGVIDKDYFYADNEGHIHCSLTNDSTKGDTVSVKAGDRIVQGVFMPYGIASNSDSLGQRKGGHGSTGK